MKKFLTVLLFTWSFMASITFADDYPLFWRGNKNYPIVFGHTGTAFYLDKSSINIELNAPPYYIITAVTVNVLNSGVSPDHPKYNKDETPRDTRSYKFFYDEDEMDMREKYSPTTEWRYMRPQGINAESGFFMWVGEAVFYVATGRKFYGNYLWKDVDSRTNETHKDEQGKDRYYDVFGDKMYKRLDGEVQ